MSKRAQTGRPGTARRVMNPDESNRLFVYEYDRGSNYEQDTRLTTALSALLPEDTLVHPDQRLFQTVHLITEYAWCDMHFEMRRAAACCATATISSPHNSWSGRARWGRSRSRPSVSCWNSCRRRAC